MDLDAPEHIARRAPLNKLFGSRAVEGATGLAAAVADRLIDGMLAAGGGDFIEDFAQPFPVSVIAGLVGISNADQPRLFDWFSCMSAYFEVGPARASVLEAMAHTIAEMEAYLDWCLEQRRRDPANDLMTQILSLEGEGDPRARERTRSMLALILFAGHESTRAILGNGTLALLLDPSSLDRLRGDPGLLENAIEEMLRYDGPFMRLDRIAASPVEIGGRRVDAGQRVVLIIGAANRDPERFRAPDVFDIDRRDIEHLGFGQGEHYCLGARLARMELRVGFRKLLECLPRMRIMPPGIAWRRHFNHRGLKSMPVSFA